MTPPVAPTLAEAGFDADWYGRTYGDVALTGLTPEAHYQKYGRLLGRAPNAAVAQQMAQDVLAARPPLMGGETGGPSLHIAGRELGRFPSEAAARRARPPLAAYARMLRTDLGNLDLSAVAPDLGDAALDAAWLVGRRLKLALTAPAPLHLRIYQAPPEAPGGVTLIGGAALEAGESGFAEAELFHPVMPVLIERATPEGLTDGYGLLPFPTLLRGGLHHAEAAAWGLGRDPMADLWRLSRLYMQEMLSDLPPAIGSIPADRLDPQLAEGLCAVFDLDRSGKLVLDLPQGAVPTLAALVSRRLTCTDPAPYLVAEAGTHRPLWSVALPSETPLAPVHTTLRLVAPAPVADILTFTDASPSAAAAPKGPGVTVALRGKTPALVARALAAVRLQEGVTIDRVLIENEPNPAHRDCFVLAEGIFPGRVQAVPEWGLDPLAEAAESAALLLLLDEAVLLYDPNALAALVQLLAEHPRAGTVAPAVLHEAVFKKGTRVQLASAGLFPTGVSFSAAPRLAVAAPDVLTALPDCAYPVLANTHDACLIRLAALRDTAAARHGVWTDVCADLKFGLDARAAGWQSLCTTAIRVGTTRAPLPRLDLDPVSLAYQSPAAWAALLSEVTLVRELRG